MSIEGNWTIVVKSPMGKEASLLSAKANGEVLTGVLGPVPGQEGESSDITDGKIDGANISWKAAITKPMKMTLEFTGTLAGDTLNGKCKAGAFGVYPFEGTRG